MLVKVKYKQQDTYFLIHIEAQSYTEQDFARRMFIYFARLLEKYGLPIYPIVIFSFDQPKIPQPKVYRLTFPSLKVLRFEFAAIQLNRLSWKKYLKHQNPVALLADVKNEHFSQAKTKGKSRVFTIANNFTTRRSTR